MNKKHLIIFFVLITSVVFFSGCSLIKSDSDLDNVGELEQKNAEISITGKLTKNGELFFVTDSKGTLNDVETYSVPFEDYVGQTVTVTGQYSGNTLFVTQISQ